MPFLQSVYAQALQVAVGIVGLEAKAGDRRYW